MSLLETGLWSACLVLITVHLLEICYAPPGRMEPFVFSVLLVVPVLTRPESLLLGVVFLVVRCLLIWKKKQFFIPAIQATILPAFFFIAGFSGLIFFRLRYFGYPYPNTYYAKVSTSHIYNIKEGSKYFRDGLCGIMSWPSSALP